MAQSEPELATSKVLWQALQEWQDIADTVKENGLNDTLFTYAHNNANFDGVVVMHSILSSTNTPCDDMLESNGKFISFRWKNLVFRDSMLIATSSLAEAAKAHGIKNAEVISSPYLSPKRQLVDRAATPHPLRCTLGPSRIAHGLVP